MPPKLKSVKGLSRKRKVKKSSPNIGVKRSPATKSVIIKVAVPRAPAGRKGTKRKVLPRNPRALAGRKGTKRKVVIKASVKPRSRPRPRISRSGVRIRVPRQLPEVN